MRAHACTQACVRTYSPPPPMHLLAHTHTMIMQLCTRGYQCCFMGAAINKVRTRGESCGGEVTCIVRRCPKGLGTPVFSKLEAELALGVMSLPATKVRGLRCT